MEDCEMEKPGVEVVGMGGEEDVVSVGALEWLEVRVDGFLELERGTDGEVRLAVGLGRDGMLAMVWRMVSWGVVFDRVVGAAATGVEGGRVGASAGLGGAETLGLEETICQGDFGTEEPSEGLASRSLCARLASLRSFWDIRGTEGPGVAGVDCADFC